MFKVKKFWITDDDEIYTVYGVRYTEPEPDDDIYLE